MYEELPDGGQAFVLRASRHNDIFYITEVYYILHSVLSIHGFFELASIQFHLTFVKPSMPWQR